jgi:GMP synthase (glutamine-hydrolysing)
LSAGHETIAILDFGSQYTQLIARRVRELGVYSEILGFNTEWTPARREGLRGVILSGGPDSVYGDEAPQADGQVFELGVPVLGICYGMQWMMRELGGDVVPADEREYGPATVRILADDSVMLKGLSGDQAVWASHGDSVRQGPSGFARTAESSSAPLAAVEHRERGLYGLQFHPEVAHTVNGKTMLKNFLFEACRCRGDWTMQSFVEESVAAVREQVGDGHVICGLSGGVDSSLGDFRERYHLQVDFVDAGERFLGRLAGVEEPERKRKIIGETFIEVFEEQARGFKDAAFLAQGTIYPDRIESAAVGGPSATIKTHHNVGGLPERMKLQLVEPLRDLFKDEVRRVGRELGLDPAFVGRHPFPGPGLAVRILGEVNPERVALLQEADDIFIRELRDAGLYDKTAQAFVVLLPVRTVGVMGDFRTYEHVVALRAVTTVDFMTADWARLPEDFLARVSSRLVNEVRGINRVVYDITSKPPGTIEWE